jgi:hypothetical protein
MALFPYLFSAGCPDWVSIIGNYKVRSCWDAIDHQKPVHEITSVKNGGNRFNNADCWQGI